MINLGLIGSGVTLRTHLPAFRRTGGADVKSIYSPNYQRLAELAHKNGIERVCRSAEEVIRDPEIDLVIVASPNSLHEKHIRMCVSENKAFLCEKPLGLTGEEARRIAKLVPPDYPSWCGVNHQLRFNPYLKRIREIVIGREYGSVISLRISQLGSAFSNPEFPWSWSFDTAQGGGVRLAMGSHLVDLASFICDSRFGRIDAGMNPVIRERRRGTERIPVETSSTFVAFGEMASGETVYLSATAAGFSGTAFEIEVLLERAEIRFDLHSKLRVFDLQSAGVPRVISVEGVTPEERENKVSIFSGSEVYFAEQIVRDVSAGWSSTVGACTLEEAAYVSDVLDQALLAYRQGAGLRFGPISSYRASS